MVIAACPGSGKTTVLKHRAQHLLETHPDERLAAVTYTREAAASLRERIVQQYPLAKKRMDAGTFHSLCISQLRMANRKFKTLETPHAMTIIRQAIGRCPHASPELKFEDYQKAINDWQCELDPVVPPAESSALAFVYREYTKVKRSLGLLDFADMLRDALMGMQSGQVKPLNVKFMLVDEFQDTDGIQLAWCLEHAKHGTDITIVGDDDQSIYGFRGSLGYAGMEEFRESTGATMIMLDRTYRCTQEIFKPAARLINHNNARVAKSLQTNCTDTGEVIVRAFESREAEAQAVVDMISLSDDPSEWAVLARTNAQLESVESSIGQRFPYHRKKGSSFWELKEPAMLIRLSKSIVGGDMVGVHDLLSQAGVSTSALNSMSESYSSEAPGSLSRFCNGRLPRMTGGDKSFVSMLQSQIGSWQPMLRSNRQSDVKLAIGGMANCIAQYGRWRPNDVESVRKRLGQASSAIVSAKGPVSQRLHNLTRTKEDNEKAEGVALLTLHSSKGLEFDNVWIVGCEAGTLPSTREDTDIQEERRLAYVGMTRARVKLVMSYSLEGKHSQFLEEANLLGQGFLQRDVA